ncbi:unnamed protein product [Vitrella brassicaformis CCMP3155]|uniref:Uncharacterized protein n=2 Tax=Vitrella brassicaformis TaxID=1169539 RepID=A0A0G4H7Q1_VITBC|nr:unnamed protein product [Vitrella brassicaformis CCMP3155]|eukprot:CEM39944.1 unnamed protein product [Vitrella brassicaformis CCMP3155]
MKAPVENKDVLREGLAVGGGILMGMMAASGPAAAAGLTQMPLSQTDQFPLDFSEPFILAGTTIVGSALIFAAAVAVRYAQIQNERATLQEQQQQQQQQQPIKVAEETAASTTPPPPAAGGAEVIAPPPQEAANESVEVPPALMKAAQQEESAPWVEPETPPPPPLKKLEAKKEPSAPVTSAPESPRTAAQTPPTAVQPPEPIAEPPAAPPAGAKVAVAGEGAYVMDADRAKWERWSRLSEEEVQAEMEREMQEEEEAEQRRREDLAKVEAQVKPYKIDMMNRGRAEIQQRARDEVVSHAKKVVRDHFDARMDEHLRRKEEEGQEEAPPPVLAFIPPKPTFSRMDVPVSETVETEARSSFPLVRTKSEEPQDTQEAHGAAAAALDSHTTDTTLAIGPTHVDTPPPPGRAFAEPSSFPSSGQQQPGSWLDLPGPPDGMKVMRTTDAGDLLPASELPIPEEMQQRGQGEGQGEAFDASRMEVEVVPRDEVERRKVVERRRRMEFENPPPFAMDMLLPTQETEVSEEEQQRRDALQQLKDSLHTTIGQPANSAQPEGGSAHLDREAPTVTLPQQKEATRETDRGRAADKGDGEEGGASARGVGGEIKIVGPHSSLQEGYVGRVAKETSARWYFETGQFVAKDKESAQWEWQA